MSPASDTYAEVTERILAALDRGVAPWHQPWASLAPTNVRTKRAYRGINVLLLSLEARSDSRWGTFKAWQEVGASVRKGEKGTRIVFWKRIQKKGQKLAEAEAAGKATAYAMLRTYCVFNAEQVDNAPALPPRAVHFNPLAEAEAVMADYPNGPEVSVGGDAAYYMPSADSVQLPSRDLFEDSASWYAVAFHELTHSAGSESRCGGLVPATFGSEPYAREELVAELGAAMLGGWCQLEVSLDSSAAYIKGWTTALQNDPRLIVSAAAEAQRRSDHILDIGYEVPAEQAADSEALVTA